MTHTNDAVPALLGARLPTGSTPADLIARLRLEDAQGRPYTPQTLPSGRALRGETVENVTVVAHYADGSARWLSLSAAPIFGPKEEIQGAAVIVHDLSTRSPAVSTCNP